MGFFSFLFGRGEFKQSKLSDEEYPLSKEEVEHLISWVKIKSLSETEEHIVRQAILNRRLSDRKISLRQIDEVLGQLKHQGKISEYDRKALVQMFETYFKNK